MGPIVRPEPVSIGKAEPVGAVVGVKWARDVRGAQLGTRVSARSKSGDQDVAGFGGARCRRRDIRHPSCVRRAAWWTGPPPIRSWRVAWAATGCPDRPVEALQQSRRRNGIRAWGRIELADERTGRWSDSAGEAESRQGGLGIRDYSRGEDSRVAERRLSGVPAAGGPRGVRRWAVRSVYLSYDSSLHG